MKNVVTTKYQELLTIFNSDARIKKLMRYFQHQSILNYFSDALTTYYGLAQATLENQELQNVAYLPLLSQRLLVNGEIMKIIVWIKENYHLNEINLPNFEEEIIQNFRLTETEIADFFSFNVCYSLIAFVYSQPFINLASYPAIEKFFYYLIMYINLELSFNKFIIQENYELFLAKLDLQLKMIYLLADLNPENYNELIRELNHWFTKKALYKVTRKEKKHQGGTI